MLSSKEVRLAGDFFTELAIGNHTSGESHSAYKYGKNKNKGGKSRCIHNTLIFTTVFKPGEKQTCRTAEAVKYGDHFRHCGHGNKTGRRKTDTTAYGHTKNDPLVINALGNQGCTDGQQHAHGGNHISLPGCGRRTQHLKTHDKHDSRDDIAEINEHIEVH